MAYFLQDEFTTEIASPLPNPLPMEPGGSIVTSWTLTDPVPKLSKASSEFVQGTGGSNNATYIRSTQLIPHAAGRAIGVRFTGIPNNGVCLMYWYPTLTARRAFEFTPVYALGAQIQTLYVAPLRGTPVYSPLTAIVVWRDNGSTYWIINDYLVYAGDPDENADKSDSYLWLYNYYAAETMHLDWVRGADLGAPFNTDFALATSRTASPASGQTGTHETDFSGYFKWTPGASETLTWKFRISDSDNYYSLVCSQAGSTIKLYRVEAATPTELNTGKTMTWTVGSVYRIVVRCLGGYIWTQVNNITGSSSADKHTVSGETFNLTATDSEISGFATGANFEFYPMTLTGAALTEKNTYFATREPGVFYVEA